MKSFLERLGIVEKDNTQAPTEVALAVTAASAPAMQPGTPSAALTGFPSVATSASDQAGVLDTTSVENQIVQMVEINPAYLAYKTLSDAAAAMAGVIQDEKTRFQAASATTKLTFSEVQPSLASWEAVVVGEEANFEASYVAQSTTAISVVDTQIQATESELAALATKLGELSDQKNKLMQEKVQRESELAKAKIDFHSVVQTLTNRYTVMASKLAQYLGTVNGQ